MLIKVFQNGILVKEYVNAQVGYALGEVVPDEEYEKRRLACFGSSPGEECDQLKRRADGRAYCGLCGCGSRDEALLDEPNSKLRRFARIECKLGKFGKVNTVKAEFPELP